jgi:chloramphenicol 3-O-phosphotransferase
MKRIVCIVVFMIVAVQSKVLLTDKQELILCGHADQSMDDGPPGRVIFITGSCSSGKSSLARLVAQDLHASYFAFDEYVMPIVLKKMVEKTVGKFIAFFITKFVVRNFFTFVGFLSDKKKYAFQKKFYNELRRGIATGPTIAMYKVVKSVALSGQNVVVEAPLHLGEGVDCLSSLSELKDLDVSFILAYCPWETLAERIEQRNTSSNKKTHRELDWALSNFAHYFDASIHYYPSAIDSIQGSVVRNALEVYPQPQRKKKRLRILEETKRATLQLFATDETYYIYPKLTYDLIVNTKSYNPEHAAEQVLDFLHHKAASRFDGMMGQKALYKPA